MGVTLMSKYTTEVRFICESKAGLSESGNADDVDSVIAKSWDKIFTTKVSFFDEEYRSVLCQKILKHFYLREICSETVGVWKLWVNTRLEEIMPYYNQLYESAKLDFNPLHDVDVTRTQNRVVDGTKKEDENRTEKRDDNRSSSKEESREISSSSESNNSGNGTRTSNGASENERKDLYSDTPQGAITGLESETYLTNARKINDNGSSNGTDNNSSTVNSTDSSNSEESVNGSNNETLKGNVEGTTTSSGVSNTTENYIETLVGKQGGESYSGLLIKFRETLLNIDMQVIHEFDDLFFGLW